MIRLATWEYDKSIFRRCEEQWKWFFFVKEVKPLRTYSEDKASHTHWTTALTTCRLTIQFYRSNDILLLLESNVKLQT